MADLLSKIQSLTEALVGIRSVSSSQSECRRAIDYVEGLFQKTPWNIQRFEHNGVYSVYISKNKTLESQLLFLGHVDVVAAPDELFIPNVKDGWIYGRGAADMKGSVAAMIQLFLDSAGDPVFSSHALLITTDEETGGFNGVGHLTGKLGLRTACVFNPDGGKAFTPCTAEKGILMIALEASGVSAHGSRPWEGRNAIDLLFSDINRLRQTFKYADKNDDWKISFNLGKIEGGNSVNSVPDRASAQIDLRFPAPLKSREIVDQLKSKLEHSTLKVLIEAPPLEVPADDPNFLALMNALKQHGFNPTTVREHGGSDARWFIEQGASTLLMLPQTTAFHIDEEAVNAESLVSLYQVLKSFVQIR